MLIAQSNVDTFPTDKEKVSRSKGVAERVDATIPFPVLCMYDFSDVSDEVISFRKGEILDIIQCRDDSGWWAAMRTEESKVGWISKLYVQRLSKEMAEKLRKIPQVVRVHEYNAEQLYNSPVGYILNCR
jgi:hypothetical protein